LILINKITIGDELVVYHGTGEQEEDTRANFHVMKFESKKKEWSKVPFEKWVYCDYPDNLFYHLSGDYFSTYTILGSKIYNYGGMKQILILKEGKMESLSSP
jgi:hypothetical protein